MLKKIYFSILILISLSIPIETLLPYYFSVRSQIYYLSIIGLFFGLLHYKEIYKQLKQSKGLLLIIISFLINILIYFVFPIRENDEYILIFQLILLCLIFIPFGINYKSREKLIFSFWLGWVILIVLSLIYYASGNISTMTDRNLDLERVISILGFSAAQHGAYVSTGLFTAIILALNEKKTSKRFFYILSILIGSIVIFMTASRTALFSFFFLLTIFILVKLRAQKVFFLKKQLPILFIIIISSLFIIFITETGSNFFRTFAERVENLIQLNDFSGRDSIYRAAFELVRRNPNILVIGLGHGNAQLAISSYLPVFSMGKDLHNYFLRFLIEGGLLSFTLFIIGLLFMIKNGWSWYKNSGEGYYLFPFILLLIISFGGRTFNYKILWFFLAFNTLTPMNLKNLKNITKIENS